MAAFDAWWRRRRKKSPEYLDLAVDDLLDDDLLGDGGIAVDELPSTWPVGEYDLRLDYVFSPGDPDDGVTVEVPPEVVGLIDPVAFEWHVPGQRREIVERLVRRLPKPIRRQLVPVPDTVDDFMTTISTVPLGSRGGSNGELGLADAVRELVARRTGQVVSRDDMRAELVPDHLRVRFRLVDGSDDPLTSTSIGELRDAVDRSRRSTVASSRHPVEATGQTEWTFGSLPRQVELGGNTVAYPALVDEGDTIGVRLTATPGEQAISSWAGARRLVRLHLGGLARSTRHLMGDDLKLGLAVGPYADTGSWFEDCVSCAVESVVEDVGLPWNEADAARLVAHAKDVAIDRLSQVIGSSTRMLGSSRRVGAMTAGLRGDRVAPSAADIEAHRSALVRSGMLTDAGMVRLADVERYLKAIEVRVERLGENVRRDQEGLLRCRKLEQEYADVVALTGMTPDVEDVAWLLQEFRVATFAQTVGAKGPVSEQRIRNRLRDLRHS